MKAPDQLLIEPASLDRVMPMHVVVNATGHIVHAGPTLLKLRPENSLLGQRLLEVFELRRPSQAKTMADLRPLVGRALHFALRGDVETRLTGIAMPLGADGGLLLNLSFGIAVVDSVGAYGLTNADFAPTDLAVEMLYLVEAKSAAMDESRDLNTRLQGAKIAAEEQAFTDTLTGLKNRRAMDHILGRIVAAGADFSLMHLDLDYFKLVNDTLGHAAGDHVLQVAAQIMVEASRAEDTVARVGGDEFVLLFVGLSKEDRLMQIAEKIIEKLEQPVPFNGKKCRISGSIGIVRSCDYSPLILDKMLEDADAALYASKNKGRACATMYSDELLSQPGLTDEPTGRSEPPMLF